MFKTWLILSSIVAACHLAQAETVRSPKGEEVFGSLIGVPPARSVSIGWSYPVDFETPDLVFKVYHSTSLNRPLREWALLTNIPGSLRGATLTATQSQEFFIMTASNFMGESGFGSAY